MNFYIFQYLPPPPATPSVFVSNALHCPKICRVRHSKVIVLGMFTRLNKENQRDHESHGKYIINNSEFINRLWTLDFFVDWVIPLSMSMIFQLWKNIKGGHFYLAVECERIDKELSGFEGCRHFEGFTRISFQRGVSSVTYTVWAGAIVSLRSKYTKLCTNCTWYTKCAKLYSVHELKCTIYIACVANTQNYTQIAHTYTQNVQLNIACVGNTHTPLTMNSMRPSIV